jgi:ribosomal protein L35
LILQDKRDIIPQLSESREDNWKKTMKTNKSFLKRLKVTKNGKILARKPGLNHFNAKASRSKQLAGKRAQDFAMTGKEKSRFLPGMF